jgi:hypothetical protein
MWFFSCCHHILQGSTPLLKNIIWNMFTFMHDFLEGLIQQKMKEKRENERAVRMNIKDYERSVPSKNERQTRSPSTRNQRLVSLSVDRHEEEEESDPQTYDSRRGFHTLSLFLLLLNIL